jgi:hypothetical protein
MSLSLDPFWIASQLQLSLPQLLAVPLITLSTLWLFSRIVARAPLGNYDMPVKGQTVLRFAFGFIGGLIVLSAAMVAAMTAVNNWKASAALTCTPSASSNSDCS